VKDIGGAPLVIKCGGELLEQGAGLATLVRTVARIATSGMPLVIVHGAGKEIDVALASAGIAKRQVDGLRVTDPATLDVVVAVLGVANTRFVAALNASGIAAVGLTGADGRCGAAELAPHHRATDGRLVDLGRVGVPSDRADIRLLAALMSESFVPVVACIGVDRDGGLLNVNADTFAGHLAARVAAKRLVIAGTTPGVLDESGTTMRLLDEEQIERLIAGRTATAGMIAKLRACEHAVAGGVGEVVIVDGRDAFALEAAAIGEALDTATRVIVAENAR
jgi:acetylglutamate kinase